MADEHDSWLEGIGVDVGSVLQTAQQAVGDINAVADESQLRTLDLDAETEMIARIDAAKAEGNTLGGIAEVVCDGVPVGLGSHISWSRKLDARLAAALMSIPAVKAVEIGLGVEAARRRGTEVHDEIDTGALIEVGPPFARSVPLISLIACYFPDLLNAKDGSS